jgi:hypothetical protein
LLAAAFTLKAITLKANTIGRLFMAQRGGPATHSAMNPAQAFTVLLLE